VKLLKLLCNSPVTLSCTPISLSFNKIYIYKRKELQELQKTKLGLCLEKANSFFEKRSKELQIQNKKKCNSCNSKIITSLTCWFSKCLQRLMELQEGRNSYIGVTVTWTNKNGWKA